MPAPSTSATSRNKVGTQLLISPHIKTRGQGLAIVRQEAVAEIWRVLVEAQLPHVESAHHSALQDLYGALDHMKVDHAKALQAMIEQKIRYADLFLADGSPRARFPGKLG